MIYTITSSKMLFTLIEISICKTKKNKLIFQMLQLLMPWWC